MSVPSRCAGTACSWPPRWRSGSGWRIVMHGAAASTPRTSSRPPSSRSWAASWARASTTSRSTSTTTRWFPRRSSRSGRADSPSTAGSWAASSSAAATPGSAGCPCGPYLDIAAPSLALGQAIGRWGNFFNEEAFGTPTNLPWKLFISQSQRPLEYAQAEFFHPTFLYESLWDAVVFALLVWVFRKRLERAPGALFLIYVGLYSIGRFMTEALRTDALMLGPIRVAQLVSLLGVAAALLGVPWLVRRAKRSGVGAEPRRVMTRYESRDGRMRLFRGDSRRLGADPRGERRRHRDVAALLDLGARPRLGRALRAAARRRLRPRVAPRAGVGRRPLARDRRPARRRRVGGAGRGRDGLAPPHGLAASVEGLLGADATRASGGTTA